MRVSCPVAPSWRARIARAIVSFVAIVGVASCGKVESNKTPDATVPGDDAMADDAGIDAPPKACTETTCTNDVLEVCGSDGLVERTEQCALGCFTSGNRCNAVDPSNGLASHLDQAAQQADVTLPDATTINTDNGMVMSPNGPIAVATATVAQSGAPTIRVLIAKSWTIDNVRVTGSLPLALVASEAITIRGLLDASADAHVAGPGALSCASAGAGGAPGPGSFDRIRNPNSGGYPDFAYNINGSGGGGFGTAGGNGGVESAQLDVGIGGAVNGTATLVPLRGGCPGYAGLGTSPGTGGGAIQLVSAKQVVLVDTGTRKGIVHVGGGAGRGGALGRNENETPPAIYGSSGGGSGGGILIEAPSVVLEDGTALLAAGGGGGGYGACTGMANGTDAPPGVGTPNGGACPAGTSPTSIGGNGATTGAGGVGGDTTQGSAGSGGGGLGRIRVNTANGQYTTGTGAVVRGTETTGMVGKR